LSAIFPERPRIFKIMPPGLPTDLIAPQVNSSSTAVQKQ
jgi:hypothetical protein